MIAAHPLDNPALGSLLGAHARLAERCGRAFRYQPEVSPFIALPAEPAQQDWDDLARLLGPAALAVTAGVPATPPPGWQVLTQIDGVQMTGEQVRAAADPETIPLGAADVPAMTDLVARTDPGPFRPRTVELGGYLGIRRDGALIAMAGQRFRPSGWTEISLVCTDDAFRGQGLATRLTLAVAAAIRDRGDTPFLHVAASNTGAIRLYETLGFRLRRAAPFVLARTPPAGQLSAPGDPAVSYPRSANRGQLCSTAAPLNRPWARLASAWGA
jgi:ribosomal protein S18 acetylase RimI-like enzyme